MTLYDIDVVGGGGGFDGCGSSGGCGFGVCGDGGVLLLLLLLLFAVETSPEPARPSAR